MNSFKAIKQRHEKGCKVSRETDEVSLMHLDIDWLINEINRLTEERDSTKTISRVITDEEMTIIANKIADILLEKEVEREKERAEQIAYYVLNTPFDRGVL